MQVNHVFDGPKLLNDQPLLRQPAARLGPSESSVPAKLRPLPDPVGPPLRQSTSFGNLINRFREPLFPISKPASPSPSPSPLGEPPHVDQLGTRVHDYRETLDSVHADLISQLKSATETLKEARKSGDHDAITAAQTAIDNLNLQLRTNRESLSVVHDDVKGLREMRQQLSADVKAGNLDAIQQDRDAISQQRDQVLADLQA